MESKRKQKRIWQPKKAQIKKTLIDAENIIGEKYPMLLGTAATVAGITQFYTLRVLFVGLFIGIVFFVSAGSFYTSVYIVI